ncbi:hypothetical protein [Mycoplasmopsis cynos]
MVLDFFLGSGTSVRGCS